jgi:hypothetical protein
MRETGVGVHCGTVRDHESPAARDQMGTGSVSLYLLAESLGMVKRVADAHTY